MRGDRQLRISLPLGLLGNGSTFAKRAPQALDRQRVAEQIARLDQRGHARVAAIASLARELGLRFRKRRCSTREQRIAKHRARSESTSRAAPKAGGVRKSIAGFRQSLALATLARAMTLQGDRADLLPEGMSFREWRDHAYGVWGRSGAASGLTGFHDLGPLTRASATRH